MIVLHPADKASTAAGIKAELVQKQFIEPSGG